MSENMSETLSVKTSRGASLRSLAKRNFVLSLLLFFVLIAIVYVSSQREKEAMNQLESVYHGQFQIEQFKASLTNIMVPMNDFTMTADEKNFPVLNKAVKEYQRGYQQVGLIAELNEQDRKALAQVAGLMEEVMNIANDIASKKIQSSQASQLTLLSQNLVLTAQKKLTVITRAMAARLQQRSAQHQQDVDMQTYILLGFIALIILLLELLNRGLLSRALVVSRASNSVAESVGDILEASEMQSGASEQQSRFMQRVTNGLTLIAEAGQKVTANIRFLEKNAQVSATFASGASVEAQRSMDSLKQLQAGLEQLPEHAGDVELRLVNLTESMERIREIMDEAQLLVLNASIDGATDASQGISQEVQNTVEQTRDQLDLMRSELAAAGEAMRSVHVDHGHVLQLESLQGTCSQTNDVLTRLEGMAKKDIQAITLLVQASERQNERNGKILKAIQHISELLQISGDKMKAHKEASARLSEASESLQNMA